jgi:hypothetical protein
MDFTIKTMAEYAAEGKAPEVSTIEPRRSPKLSVKFYIKLA